MRHRSYGPLDDPPLPDGDGPFYGVRTIPGGDLLPPGFLSDGENLRFRDGIPGPRRGITKPGWLNVVDFVAHKILPFGKIHGKPAQFRDPNSIEWTVFAADGFAYRAYPANAAFQMTLPTGVRLLSRVKFVQAFNKLYCFRGNDLAPLVLSDVAVGFVDIVVHWDVATPFAPLTEVAYGPFIDVDSITSDGNTATVITADPHGYISGADITLSGASQTEYNGRFNITRIDDRTFTYQFAGSATTPATGTLLASNMSQYWSANSGGSAPSAGDSPDSEPTKWTLIFNVIPNGVDAVYVNNRLVIATAWTPGANATDSASAYDSSSVYGKTDFLVATDFIDQIHFDFTSNFRINQGSDDEIFSLVVAGNDVVVLKSKSWAVVGGIGLDLTNVTLDVREKSYGLVAPDAFAVAGAEIFMMVEKRGVVALRQSETDNLALKGILIPHSKPAQAYIDKINWAYSSQIRLEFWENKLFVAAPLRDALVVDAYHIPPISPGGITVSNFFTTIPGERYLFIPGDNEVALFNGDAVIRGRMEFIAAGDSIRVASDGGEFTGSLVRVWRGANSGVIVWDGINGEAGEWSGVDSGPWSVQEFFKPQVGGVQRLGFCGRDGFNNLVEEAHFEDQVRDADRVDGLGWAPIRTLQLSRAYQTQIIGYKSWDYLELSLSTVAPNFTITAITEGVKEEEAIPDDVTGLPEHTKSPTRYYDPWDEPDWNPTNANEDFLQPFREDYSPILDPAGVKMTNLTLGLRQDFTERAPVRQRGRSFQVRIVNTAGALFLRGLQPRGRESDRRMGTLV